MKPASMAGAAALLVMLAGSASTAQTASPAAEGLFQDGRRLLREGRTDEACARFSESFALQALSGTLLNLALCHETQGKTATAWAEYRVAARLARNQGREDRAEAADAKAEQLDERLPRLKITVARAAAGLKLAIDEHSLGEGTLGAAVPIDPGHHVVTVTAPGYEPRALVLELKEGEQRIVELPALERIQAPIEPIPGPASVATEHGTSTSLVAISNPPTERARVGPGAWIVGGAGVVAVGLVVGFGLSSMASYHRANDLCPTHRECSGEATAERGSAETKAWIADGALAASFVAAVVEGYILWKLRRERSGTSAGVTALPVRRLGVAALSYDF